MPGPCWVCWCWQSPPYQDTRFSANIFLVVNYGSGTFIPPGSLQNKKIDQNHQKIIQKFSERKLILLRKVVIWQHFILIFGCIICSSNNNHQIWRDYEIWNFSIFGQIQAGSGSGSRSNAKLSGSATLINFTICKLFIFT